MAIARVLSVSSSFLQPYSLLLVDFYEDISNIIQKSCKRKKEIPWVLHEVIYNCQLDVKVVTEKLSVRMCLFYTSLLSSDLQFRIRLGLDDIFYIMLRLQLCCLTLISIVFLLLLFPSFLVRTNGCLVSSEYFELYVLWVPGGCCGLPSRCL